MKSPEKYAGKIAGLTVARMKLSDLVPHPQNPRHHPEPGSPAWESLKKSLEHDFFDPLIANVLDGEAAALLGFTDLDLANMLRVSEGDKTGAEELNREAFSEFDHKCPRCQFEFDDKSD